jgi:hypothetical protein
MKKLLILSAVVILATTVNAQSEVATVKTEKSTLRHEESAIKKEKKAERKELRKLEGKQVSYQSKQAFIGDFGKIPVSKWERTSNYDEATFTSDGQVMKAYYDADAKLVGTTSHKTFADLPAAAQKYINAKYHGFSKADIIFFDDNELNETDMVMFGTQFDDADNYFVDLKKDNKEIILEVTMSGEVSFFKQIK